MLVPWHSYMDRSWSFCWWILDSSLSLCAKSTTYSDKWRPFREQVIRETPLLILTSERYMSEYNSNNYLILLIFRLMMYIKLFSIMGGTWLMEFISWALESWSGIWHLFDIINCLKGLWLVIFCVFLSQRVRSKLTRHAIFCHCGQGAIITAQNSSKTTTSEKYDPIELASLAKKNYEIVDAQAAWKFGISLLFLKHILFWYRPKEISPTGCDCVMSITYVTFSLKWRIFNNLVTSAV